MKRLASLLILLAGLITYPANAADTIKRGSTQISGSIFNYNIASSGAEKRRIEVIHNEEKYNGPLAAMSFRNRHLQVFKMVALLIKNSCRRGVSSLGNMYLSRDPEQGKDPGAEHPKYFIWEYSCQ
jgi:hypothetical protein